MRKLTKRSVAIVTGSILAVAGGTAAFAYASGWFSSTGTTYAAASTIQTVRATVDVRSTRLHPGISVPITSATIANPNEYPVQIETVSISDVASNKTGCDSGQADLEFRDLPEDTVVPAGTTRTNVDLGELYMGEDAGVACSGATFTVTMAMTGGIADPA